MDEDGREGVERKLALIGEDCEEFWEEHRWVMCSWRRETRLRVDSS